MCYESKERRTEWVLQVVCVCFSLFCVFVLGERMLYSTWRCTCKEKQELEGLHLHMDWINSSFCLFLIFFFSILIVIF